MSRVNLQSDLRSGDALRAQRPPGTTALHVNHKQVSLAVHARGDGKPGAAQRAAEPATGDSP